MLSPQDLYDNVFGSASPKDMSSGFGINPNSQIGFKDPLQPQPSGPPSIVNKDIQQAPSLSGVQQIQQAPPLQPFGNKGPMGDDEKLTRMLGAQVNQYVPKVPGNFGGFSSFGDPSRYTDMWNTSKNESSGYLQTLMKFMGGG